MNNNIKPQTWFWAGCLLGLVLMLLVAAAPPKYATTTEASVIASNAAKSLMVWTNDGNYIFPLNQVSPTNGVRLHDNGRIAIGKVVDYWWGAPSANDLFIAMNNLLSGESSTMNFRMETLDDVFGTVTNDTYIEFNQNNQSRAASVTLHTDISGGSVHEFVATLAPAEPKINFTVLGVLQFAVNGAGRVTANGGFADQSTSSIPTNTASFSLITTNLLSGQVYTNLAQRAHVVATVGLTNVLAGDYSAMALIVDQNGDGTWDSTNGPVSIQGVALSAAQHQLAGRLQPGARFSFTNQSAGATPGSAVIRPGSCQWSRE